jgi:nitronate monooxygenase
MTTGRLVFRTRLCDLLAIDYPVLQSGMGLIAGPDLVAEVSGAGALGIVAGFMLSADQLRAAIREVRARTNRPFGVNLWLSADLRTTGAAAAPTDDSIQAVQAALNPIRATLGLPAVTARPSPPPDHLVPAALQVVLEERVPVLSIVMGSPDPDLVAECHRRDIKVIAMVTTVADAMTVEAAGVDAVVAQGAEAGGHRAHFEKPSSPERGAVGTLALVPQVVDALRVPVVAAGGIADGRGLVAALALGATGVLLGTRFVATRESMAFASFKKALLEESGDDTSVTDAFTGRYARVLRTAFLERYGRSGAPVLPFPWQYLVAADIYREAVAKDHRDYFPLVAGQSVGLINNLPTAAEVVDSVIREARAVLQEQLPRDLSLGGGVE